MKIIKLPLLFVIILIGCNNIHNNEKFKNDNNSIDPLFKEGTIYWNKETILKNDAFDNFFLDYLNDSTINKNEFFFLNIFGRYDSISFVLSPVMISCHNVNDTRPIGIMKKNGKLIFIIDPLSDIAKHDTTEYIVKKFKEALRKIKIENISGYKIWMLKLSLYNNGSEIIKNSKLIEEHMYNIKFINENIFK